MTWRLIDTAERPTPGGDEVLLCQVHDDDSHTVKIGFWDGDRWNIGEPFMDEWAWTHWQPIEPPPPLATGGVIDPAKWRAPLVGERPEFVMPKPIEPLLQATLKLVDREGGPKVGDPVTLVVRGRKLTGVVGDGLRVELSESTLRLAAQLGDDDGD
jgi:hypothetical protein